MEELEGRLREQVALLTGAGLSADEAFLIAARRVGRINGRLRKQLVRTLEPSETQRNETGSDAFVALGLAITAAVAIKVPALFGVPMDGRPLFYARNASLFVLPLLAAYFIWKRGLSVFTGLCLMLPFAGAAVFANAFPFDPRSSTQTLSILHLPIVLWLVVGVAYAGGRWFAGSMRMDFVRFSGELFIYYVLIALGGGVFTGITMMLFNAINIRAPWLASEWLIPCGAMGAVIVGSWLVEAKQDVMENMAPVLTRLFTPMFTGVLLVFLGTMAWMGRPIDVKREVLIAFDVLLALVTGLVLYAVSSRDPRSSPDFSDGLQLVLILCALLADALALTAIAARISEFGFTPNRVAALGGNLVLLVHLTWSALLYFRFLRGRGSFAALEHWQVAYLPAYSVWAAIVVVFFPPMFGYR